MSSRIQISNNDLYYQMLKEFFKKDISYIDVIIDRIINASIEILG